MKEYDIKMLESSCGLSVAFGTKSYIAMHCNSRPKHGSYDEATTTDQ